MADKRFSLDAHLNDYAVLLFGAGGVQWDLTQLVTSLTWSESFDSPAVELTLSLAAVDLKATVLEADARKMTGNNPDVTGAVRHGPVVSINNLVKLGMGIRVFGAIPDPSGHFVPLVRAASGSYSSTNELFRGFIFHKSRAGASVGDSIEITVYDQMIYLAKNDYDTIFKKQTATHIIKSLCDRAGVRTHKVGKDFADTHAKISRMVSYGNTLYDCCYLAIQKNKRLTGRYYRLRSEKGIVCLRQRKTPTQVWYLTNSSNIIDSQHSESIEDLVTGVQPKTSGVDGRAQYGKSVVNNHLERLYGRMRKVADFGSIKSAEVPKNVKSYMAENAAPKIENSLTIPCINTLRAGDLVKVQEPESGIVGLWYVNQVTHSVSSQSATSALGLVKTASEAQVHVVTENDPTQSTTRKVTYDKIKGKDGKYIRYRLRAGVYTPHGRFEGADLLGDEHLVKLDNHAQSLLGKTGSFVSLQYGRLSIRCTVQTRGPYSPYNIMVSDAAAQHLGISNGNWIYVYPLKKHVSGGAAVGGPGSGKYDSQIIDWGAKYHVEPELIKAVMKQESSFNPNIVSPAGAVGLMQLMPGTAAGMGWTHKEGSLTTPHISIKYGTKYLHQMIGMFGTANTYKLALAGYNGGPGVARRPESSWPGETRDYVRIVRKNYLSYKKNGL